MRKMIDADALCQILSDRYNVAVRKDGKLTLHMLMATFCAQVIELVHAMPYVQMDGDSNGKTD